MLIPVNNDNDFNQYLQQISTILTPRPAPAPAVTTAAAAPRVARRQRALPPRVNDSNGPPRVLQPRAPVYTQTYTRATRVYKMFDGSRGRLDCHQGTIVNSNKTAGYYKVQYEDGDTEEYDEEQIGMMLHKTNYTNITQALSTTQHKQVKAEYMNEYTGVIQYTNKV